MKFIIFTFSAYLIDETYLLAAEAGMPQLDPKYWFSQGFWLIITFVTLYILIAKLFIPKIKIILMIESEKLKMIWKKQNHTKKILKLKIKNMNRL